MKLQGLDHVAIMVKDMDRAVDFMSKLFDLKFEEVAGVSFYPDLS